ncbi:uncharacterized protein C8A04DRAFT_32806 [Dichotomopilus funicola]|uniref:Uncharacterized protein n=1 Tax=Dichotomopilus funicola TaxID=1934379 RepID=A0AAN6UXJ5_9PEZI|nr:hypothetical protein C8A04DRAFT_32806 [Dichotomopilus funicola]
MGWGFTNPENRHEQDRPHQDAEAAELLCVLPMLANLTDLEANILGGAELESLGVVVGEQLDVDETTWDLTSQQHFQPWMLKDVSEDFGDPDRGRFIMTWGWNSWRPKQSKVTWCEMYLRGLAEDLSPKSMGRSTGGRPRHTGQEYSVHLPYERGTLVNGKTGEQLPYEYSPEWIWFQFFERKPHLVCITNDTTTAPPSEGVLFSVVEYTLELVKYRLWMRRHTGSHTKPIMLVTLQNHEFAIITIAHFDGSIKKVVLRQSRQLDLRGDEPTPDALLLVRWMASRCVGETRYKDVAEYEDKLEGKIRRDFSYSSGETFRDCGR